MPPENSKLTNTDAAEGKIVDLAELQAAEAAADSYKIRDRVRMIRGILTSTDKLVFLAITDYIKPDKPWAYPSEATIAEKCGISTKTASRSIDKLARLNLLTVKRQRGGYYMKDGKRIGRPNRYAMVPLDRTSRTLDRTSVDLDRTHHAEDSLVDSLVIKKEKAMESSNRILPERLPDDWTQKAIERGLDSERAAILFEKFRAYHLAKGTEARDWRQFWFYWLLNARPPKKGTGTDKGAGVSDEYRWQVMLRTERERGHWPFESLPKSMIPAEFIERWESENP